MGEDLRFKTRIVDLHGMALPKAYYAINTCDIQSHLRRPYNEVPEGALFTFMLLQAQVLRAKNGGCRVLNSMRVTMTCSRYCGSVGGWVDEGLKPQLVISDDGLKA